MDDMVDEHRPIVLITGAAGNLGRTLAAALSERYRIIGLDLSSKAEAYPIFEADFSNASAVELAMTRVRERFGYKIARAC
jgi:nucleoside-diphosphate-sugar epimerase